MSRLEVQVVADTTAMGLSLFCALHCLALPLIVVYLPAVVAVQVGDEVFHYWMVCAVVPVSVYALTMGCNRHRCYPIVLIGATGLAILCMAIILGHESLGETGEKALTLLGASLIALGHLWNYCLCRGPQSCKCPARAQEG